MRAVEDFKSIAAVGAVAFGAPNTDDAWIEWLDHLRRDSDEFTAAELVLLTPSVEYRPPPDFEIVTRGLLCAPANTRTDPDAEFIPTETGEIDDVCAASERLCRRLADEALKAEVADRRTTPSATPAPLTDGPGASPLSAATPSGRSQSAATAPDATRTLKLKEAAKALRVSDDTLHRLFKKGKIDLFQVGSQWRVKASEVARLREQPRYKNR